MGGKRRPTAAEGSRTRRAGNNGISHYGYNKSIWITVCHGFIRRYVVTSTNLHDSQMLPSLMEPENKHDFVWADSAFSGESY
jgi:hypothetical protein